MNISGNLKNAVSYDPIVQYIVKNRLSRMDIEQLLGIVAKELHVECQKLCRDSAAIFRCHGKRVCWCALRLRIVARTNVVNSIGPLILPLISMNLNYNYHTS
jgi:hypothetical protein